MTGVNPFVPIPLDLSTQTLDRLPFCAKGRGDVDNDLAASAERAEKRPDYNSIIHTFVAQSQ
jgi:hypothetical protein